MNLFSATSEKNEKKNGCRGLSPVKREVTRFPIPCHEMPVGWQKSMKIAWSSLSEGFWHGTNKNIDSSHSANKPSW